MQGQAKPEQGAPAKVYAGIDVCKAWLDVSTGSVGDRPGRDDRFENTPKGFKALLRLLVAAGVTHVVMEPTGKHHLDLHRFLHGSGLVVCLVNPAAARAFAKSAGVKAKTDRLDARILRLMGEALDPDAVAPAPEFREHLQELIRARQSSVDDHTALSNRLGDCRDAFVRKQIIARMTLLDRDVERLEAEISRRIRSDPATARRYKILLSIPGVGPVAGAWLAVGVPELGTCTNKQAAMLVGVAPIACESGEKKGKRVCQGGRADVRRGIYMAAKSAGAHNPQLAAFFDRLIKAGKLLMVARTAVMRKLVVLANTLLREDRLWQPSAPVSCSELNLVTHQ
jgi:transposase